MNTAQKVRLRKEQHPEQYCPRCLWRTGGGFCPRHPPAVPIPAVVPVPTVVEAEIRGAA